MHSLKTIQHWLESTTPKYFPEHQIYFRTNGTVRFFTITTRMQLVFVAIISTIFAWLAFASGSVFIKEQSIAQKDNVLKAQQLQLRQMRNRMSALSSDVEDMKGSARLLVQRMRQRNAFLEQLLTHRLPLNHQTAQPLSAEARARFQSAQAALEHAPADQKALVDNFHRFDREQLAFVVRAGRAADMRYAEIDGLLRKLHTSAEALTAQSATSAIGGPLVRVSFERGAYSALEPQFKDLFLSWTKLDLLQRAMFSIPAFIPAKNFSFTSGFGFRYDPFTGGGAMHAGVDMAGASGSPIYAAATGVVTRAGWLGGYGNLVEIDHGRGMVTRYGHLSSFTVREGQRVNQGDVIAAMGSTGRSTGTHLHFEVRVDGQAVNPMPFLEAARDVFQIQQQAIDTGAPLAGSAG